MCRKQIVTEKSESLLTKRHFMLDEEWRKMEWNELGRQKLKRYNFLQSAKHVTLYFDLLQA